MKKKISGQFQFWERGPTTTGGFILILPGNNFKIQWWSIWIFLWQQLYWKITFKLGKFVTPHYPTWCARLNSEWAEVRPSLLSPTCANINQPTFIFKLMTWRWRQGCRQCWWRCWCWWCYCKYIVVCWWSMLGNPPLHFRVMLDKYYVIFLQILVLQSKIIAC